MSADQTFTTNDVEKIARQSNLQVSPEDVSKFAQQFSQTAQVIQELNEVDTSGVPEVYQVTELNNIEREDVVDPARVLSQSDALSAAQHTHQGYFVVPRVIDSSESL